MVGQPGGTGRTRAGARRPRERIASWFRRHPVTGGLAVSAVAVLVALGAWLDPRAPEPSTEVVVPDLVGVEVGLAEDSLVTLGLTAVQQPGAQSAQPGIVLAQDPPGEATVAMGSQVMLVVSVPSTTTTVPDVVGLDVDAAQEALAGADLALVRAGTRETPDVPADQVVDQSPAPGTSLDRGSQVEVTLSVAPPEAARISLIAVTTSVQDGIGVVDLTVRNDGGQVAVITQVELIITGYVTFSPGGSLQPSATYDAALPATPALPARVVVPVSQVVGPIGPDAADRFVVRLSPGGGGLTFHRYTFTVGVQEASSTDTWDAPQELTLVASTAFSADSGPDDSQDGGPDLPGSEPPPPPPTEAALP